MNRAVPVTILLVTVAGVFLLWRADSRHDRLALKSSSPHTPLQISRSRSAGFSPLIRVNVTPPDGGSLRIAVDGAYVVRPVGTSKVLGKGARLEKSAVTSSPTGIRIGSRNYPVSRLEVVPENSPAVWVGKHQYRGSLRLFRRAGRAIVAVNVLPLREYLPSVVDGEMPANFPRAARKAQAIAARTYALYQMQVTAAHPFYDVHASTQSQKYLGFQYYDRTNRRLAGESNISREIVEETRNMICTYRGRVFCTYYSAVCGGRTTPGRQVFSDAAPPLQRVNCQWCRDAKRYRWQVELSRSEFEKQLRENVDEEDNRFRSLRSITSVSQSADSGVPVFEISDGRERHRLSADEIRSALTSSRIFSPRFRIRETADRIIIEGRGHGHGVGLCQWGARGMALAGGNTLQILQHYYPGSQVVVMELNEHR